MIFFKTLITFLRDKEYRDLLFTTSVVLITGATAYHIIEGWSWVDSFYFCITTLSTVGLGDLAPKTDLGKIFTIFYIVIGIGIILAFINTLYNHYMTTSKKHKNNH